MQAKFHGEGGPTISGRPPQSISGLLRNIEALYAMVPSHARSQLLATLRMTPQIESPFIDLFGRVPESAKLEDVIDWINGVNAFYLAISSLKPEATIREAKKAAASIITSQPYLGDVDGSVNSVPLSAVLVATAHPTLAENLTDPVVQTIAAEQLAMYIASSDVPFTGGFLKNVWERLGIGKKVKEVKENAQAIKAAVEGTQPEVNRGLEIPEKLTPKPFTLASNDRPIISIPRLITAPIATDPNVINKELVNSQTPLTPTELAKMSVITSQMGNPFVQKDLAGVAKAMDDMVRQSMTQMQALSSDIESNKSALDSITNLQVKLKWMNSIAKMPDDVAVMMQGVTPDFSSTPNAVATVTGVISSIPDSTASGKVSSIWQKLISPLRGDSAEEPIPYVPSQDEEAEEREALRQLQDMDSDSLPNTL